MTWIKPYKRKISLKNTTNKQLLFGDFDRDGNPNLDDKYPFDPRKREAVNKEVKLTKAIKTIEKNRKIADKEAKKYKRKYNFDTYRIKDAYSVINKLVQTNPHMTNDFVGFRKETHKRHQAKKSWHKFNKRISRRVTNKDNKYKSLKGTKNSYRAYHTNFTLRKYGAEAQFRTRKFGQLNDRMHMAYKHKKDLKPFRIKAKKLLRQGY